MSDPFAAPLTTTPLSSQAHAVSVAQMQQIDRTAIETIGMPRLLLMEHAGLAVARAARMMLPSLARPILVCCGTGFNGGDGLAAARHLSAWGYRLRLVLAGAPERLREEPAIYATILQRLGVTIHSVTSIAHCAQMEPAFQACGLILDALLGIGMAGAVREPTASLIAAVNRSGVPVLAVDVPSGLDADTGTAQGIAVNATATVTFGRPKRGFFLKDGPAHVGALTVDPITIPDTLFEKIR